MAAASKVTAKPHGSLFEIRTSDGSKKGFLYGTMLELLSPKG
ncbi:MAG: hypothetical protein P0S95_06565 [Rhabdochlamydiaceae bacterium]|nr:hypothetical protein [Candidatus Amphrikana amoebophyrae]